MEKSILMMMIQTLLFHWIGYINDHLMLVVFGVFNSDPWNK